MQLPPPHLPHLSLHSPHAPIPRRPRLAIGAQRGLPDLDYADPSLIFSVTICAHPHTTPFTDPQIAREVVASLDWLRTHRGISLYAYCLLPDHLHLLLWLGQDGKPLGEIIGTMKSFTTKRSWGHGWKGPLWQTRFYDRVLRRSEDARAVAEYIRQNPVRRGLVTDPDAYPWTGFPDPL